MYTLIISLLFEKPFYLLRPQSFSCQIVSEFIDIFVKFSNFMLRGWGFWLSVLSRGEGFCTQWLSRGECFCILQVVSGGGGMVLDKIDTCLSWVKAYQMSCLFIFTSIYPLTKRLKGLAVETYRMKKLIELTWNDQPVHSTENNREGRLVYK